MDVGMDILELDELIVLANIDLENNKLSDALIKLKLAQQKGAAGDAIATLARLYARIGLFDKAKNCFSLFLKDNPDALVEKFQYAMTHFDSDDTATAFNEFKSILEKDNMHPPALYYSAVILARGQKTDEASQMLEKLLSGVKQENFFYLRGHELLAEINPTAAQAYETSTADAAPPVVEEPGDILLN